MPPGAHRGPDRGCVPRLCQQATDGIASARRSCQWVVRHPVDSGSASRSAELMMCMINGWIATAGGRIGGFFDHLGGDFSSWASDNLDPTTW